MDAKQQPDQPSLEAALEKTEGDADIVIKSAAAVTKAAKRFRGAAQVGNLRDLRAALVATEQAIAALEQHIASARDGWNFDEEAYFADGRFPQELLETAKRMDVRIYEQDDRLYSYPALIRVLPGDRAVLIDKTRERRLRPTVLVDRLRDLQERPPRFRPDAFLEALFDAYATIVAKRRDQAFGEGAGDGPSVRLSEVYALLTLLPGQSREYSRQEFARDIYLLDQSGVTATRRGFQVRFPASTGTRSPSSTMRVITQDGQEKVYYGLAFSAPG